MVVTTHRPVGRIPRYTFGPKPRRRTELGLLLFGDAIIVALYVLASVGQHARIPPHLGPFLGVIFGLTLVAHLANRWLVPNAHPIVLPIAALLNGIGYVIIVRWNPPLAKEQAAWVAIAMVAYVLTLLVVQRSRDLDRYRYLLLLLAVFLMVAPLIPGLGRTINGARLWVHFGKTLEFQPIELAKIFLCIFFASYFAENKEILSIPTARMGNRLVVDPRPLIPIILAWVGAMAVIGIENDIAFAMLLFTLFIGLLWVATGRVGYLVLGIVLFAAGAVLTAHLFGQVHERITIWLDPWSTPFGNGRQLDQAWYSLGVGGVGGTGLGLGQAGVWVAHITSDMIFAAIGEEMGLMGTSVVVLAFLLLVGAGLRIAQTARSDFSKLVATGLTIIIGFQAIFIMAGVIRLLPFTGITLPFVAYGGSSLVANYVLVALLLRISDEANSAPPDQAGERPYELARN